MAIDLRERKEVGRCLTTNRVRVGRDCVRSKQSPGRVMLNRATPKIKTGLPPYC